MLINWNVNNCSLLYLGQHVQLTRTGRQSKNVRQPRKRLIFGTELLLIFHLASTSQKASNGGWPYVFYCHGLSSISSRCEASNLLEKYFITFKIQIWILIACWSFNLVCEFLLRWRGYRSHFSVSKVNVIEQTL